MKRVIKILNLAFLVMLILLSLIFKTHAVSGETGELEWNFDEETFTVTISGNGEMINFSSINQVPWYKYKNEIKSVKLESGVRSIGTWAFAGCTALTEVTLTDSVEYIANAAFYNCTNLVKVNFQGSSFYWERISIGEYNEYFTSVMPEFSSGNHFHKFGEWQVVTSASINKDGLRKADCTVCDKVTIKETISAVTKVSASETYFSYTGTEINLTVRITDTMGLPLNSGTDYHIDFEDKINLGKHKAVVTFKGKYCGTYTFYYYILPSEVTNLKSSSEADSITLTWDKVPCATGYRIYIYNPENKSYSVLVKKTADTSYKITSLQPGKNYAFLVRAYTKSNNEYFYCRNFTKIITCTKPEKCSLLKVYQNTSAISFSWSRVQGATGYRVFLYDTAKKAYKALSTTTARAYKHENLNSGKAYTFVVRSYKKVNSETVWSAPLIIYTATRPEVPTELSAQVSVNAVSLSWKSSSGATGYRIYSYDFSLKQYVPLQVIKESKIKFYSLSSGKTYVYLIKPYITVGNNVIWGESAKVTVITQKDSPSAVMVSSSGKKYHRQSCPYAKTANEKMSVSTAISRGYTACSHCY